LREIKVLKVGIERINHCVAVVYITHSGTTWNSMLGLPIFFRFLLLAFVGATIATVANSKRDFALLAGTFLLGLGALEAVLNFFGF